MAVGMLYTRIMEKKMKATLVYLGYIGNMDLGILS